MIKDLIMKRKLNKILSNQMIMKNIYIVLRSNYFNKK